MYKYKAISQYDTDSSKIQKYFDEGWEYVDGFSQNVSSGGGSYSHSKVGNILIILRKEKDKITL